MQLLGGTFVFLISVLDFSLANGEEFRYDSHGKRDPFVSPAEATLITSRIGRGELRLEGVIVDPRGSSYAIVNGQIVQEGETFEGFFLKKVEPNQVLFEKDGESIELVLREEDQLLRGMVPAQESDSEVERGASEGKSNELIPKESGSGS